VSFYRTVPPDSEYPRVRGKTLVRIVGGVLEVDSIDRMSKSFAAIPRRTGHLEAAWSEWLPVWYRANRAMFRSEGPGWAQLSGNPGSRNPRGWYGPWKRHAYPGKGILQREGFLQRSLTHRGARYSIVQIGPRTLRLGTSLAYSRILEEGSRNMPPRPHVVVSSEAFAQLSRITLAHIMAAPELKGGRRR
jgi:hypothetical protein